MTRQSKAEVIWGCSLAAISLLLSLLWLSSPSIGLYPLAIASSFASMSGFFCGRLLGKHHRGTL